MAGTDCILQRLLHHIVQQFPGQKQDVSDDLPESWTLAD